jgi:hypothetical protein
MTFTLSLTVKTSVLLELRGGVIQALVAESEQNALIFSYLSDCHRS